jgi:putative pyruvate formate lyase activating enzyme
MFRKAWWLLRPDAVNILENPKVKKALPRYVKIVDSDLLARFLIAKKTHVSFDENSPEEKLWKKHEKTMKQFDKTQKKIDSGKRVAETPKQSLLDLKVTLANKLLEHCCFCERRCGANRKKDAKGFCTLGEDMRICSEFIHLGEEPWITPSHTIFFSRCNWRCVYCQNHDISQGSGIGRVVSPEDLEKLIKLRRQQSRNLNLVGGDPTPNLHRILETLKLCDENVPIVFNSNMYVSEEGMRLLDGVVDVYLADFRYFNDKCAMKLSEVPNCQETLTRNHLLAAKQCELSIRLLVLPDHIECCAKPILKWIADNIREKAIVNIMDQYYPVFKARKHPEINRRLEKGEFDKVIKYAKDLNLNFL